MQRPASSHSWQECQAFHGVTLEVPGMDGTGPVHTMVGRGRAPLNWKTELCTLSNRLRAPLLAARTRLFLFQVIVLPELGRHE